jgi:hypothetical protein
MPTQKLGRLLGMSLMLFALASGLASVAGFTAAGDMTGLEFEWNAVRVTTRRCPAPWAAAATTGNGADFTLGDKKGAG